MRSPLHPLRVQVLNQAPVRTDGDHVLYWMTSARRLGWNPALEQALAWCRHLGRPLLVFEPLRCGHRWATDRFHRFIIEGMADHRDRCAAAGVAYYPYIEPADGAGKGLLAALAERACVVVGDEFPCVFVPKMTAAAARLPVHTELVDGNGILPIRAADKAFDRAYDFRRFLQKRLPEFLRGRPKADPLAGLAKTPAAAVDPRITARWPMADIDRLLAPDGLAALPIDHAVGPAAMRGGDRAAAAALAAFLPRRLPAYGEERSHPDSDASSGLSPWLHWGHLSAHEIAWTVLDREGWDLGKLSVSTSGGKEGWWGVGASAESFLDELITWRELGYGFCHFRPDYASWDSLPAWARKTLDEHAGDPRATVYSLDAFAAGATHDPLWNAAQRQLRETGLMHNYLRMLWGKKILEWTRDPREALMVMEELNNRWAIDGSNPNSYTGIMWVLGRFDRPWAPVRPIFGSIRYMTSGSTLKKLRCKGYLARWGGGPDTAAAQTSLLESDDA
jgi:deoxyribodipyrimidine photo-lyase